MKTNLTKVILNNDLLLTNVQNRSDQEGTIICRPNTEVNLYIEDFGDGRVYKTIFKMIGQKVYMTTTMRFADGPITKCGNTPATANAIKKLLEAQPILRAKAKEFTPEEKRKMLIELIELHIYCGYDISELVGRPLNYYNYENIAESIQEMQTIKDTVDGN